MLRLGIISELGDGENLGFARVSFDDSDFVSAWLPLPSASTKTAKQWIPVEVNSQVACLMDDLCEQGGIVMVLWSEADAPPKWATSDTIGLLFTDGAEIYYDAKKHTLTVNALDSELNFKCKRLNVEGDVNITGAATIKGNTSIEGDASISGDTSTKGEIKATGEITSGAIPLSKHIHPTPAGPSSPPQPMPPIS